MLWIHFGRRNTYISFRVIMKITVSGPLWQRHADCQPCKRQCSCQKIRARFNWYSVEIIMENSMQEAEAEAQWRRQCSTTKEQLVVFLLASKNQKRSNMEHFPKRRMKQRKQPTFVYLSIILYIANSIKLNRIKERNTAHLPLFKNAALIPMTR